MRVLVVVALAVTLVGLTPLYPPAENGRLPRVALGCGGGVVFARDYFVREADSTDITFEVQGTDADTSKEYATEPVMTLAHWAGDQIHADSVNVTIAFQELGAGGWFTVESLTITADSTDAAWIITDVATPSLGVFRVTVTGNAGNRKDGEVLVRVKMGSGN
jgi:hypothetical protein